MSQVLIKEKRIEKGMKQTDVANYVGVSRKTISSYEAGRRTPKPSTAMKLGELLEFDWTNIYKDGNEQLQAKENVERHNTAKV
jgi:DNA-binding XRE family transcriptional regulator